MKMVHYRKGGFSMYTRLLRRLVKLQVRMAGHCTNPGGGSVPSGHCY